MEISARSIWERAAGLASIVATPLVPSHYVELLDPLLATHVRHARVEALHDETRDARTLTLRPGAGWRPHRAGQFVKIGVEVDGRILSRTYSITSPPERADGRITITVKALPEGRASVALARRVRPGDYLTIGLPQGDFILPERPPARVLFVTGGSGITPVMSMLRSLVARDSMPDVVHIHYVKTPPDLIFAYELARLAAAGRGYRLTVVSTRKGGRRFDRATLDELAPDWRWRETWACGPEPLLDAVAEHVAGSPHVERFRAKLAPASQGVTGGRVRFGRSKKELDASGATSLLDAAERAGVEAPHGCRMGICHSCDATLVGGCVRDLRNGRTIDEPGASIQPCVCAAAGDVEIDL